MMRPSSSCPAAGASSSRHDLRQTAGGEPEARALRRPRGRRPGRKALAKPPYCVSAKVRNAIGLAIFTLKRRAGFRAWCTFVHHALEDPVADQAVEHADPVGAPDLLALLIGAPIIRDAYL